MSKEGNYCVYKHTSPSGKVYIGITCKKPEQRWGQNGRGYKTQSVFYKAIQKYGWDNIKHEVLYKNLSHDEAIQKEIELIKKYKSNCCRYHNPMFGYNQTDGGEGGSGYVLSQEEREKMSKRMRGEGNPFYGKHHSEETINKISQMKVGKFLGEDNPNYGNYWSEEQKENMSQQRVGNITSDETKERLSLVMFGENNPMYGKKQTDESNNKNKKNQPNLKKVKCVETNMVFNSISECARYFGVVAGSISSSCRLGHACKGYHFQYLGNIKNNTNRKIKMFDKEMNYIKTFNCPKDASVELNIRIESIWNALRGETKTAHGYIWRYAD